MRAEVLVVLVGFLVRVQIGVARDLDHIGVLDGIHAEQALHHQLERMFEQDERERAIAALDGDDALGVLRHGDDAHDDVLGRLRPRRLAFGLAGFLRLLELGLVVEAHGYVERAVLQMGEGMRRVYDLRRYERQHVGVQIRLHLLGLFGRQFVGIELADAGVRQARTHGMEVLGCLRRQVAHAGIDGVELLVRRHARLAVVDVGLGKRQVEQAADAHHEELFEVRPPDGEEFQPFEQRHARIDGLVEHALVEREPGKLSVLHIGRRDRALRPLFRLALRTGFGVGFDLVLVHFRRS